MAKLTGTVTRGIDEEIELVENAEVSAHAETAEGGTDTTTPDGRYSIPVELNRRYRLTVRHEGRLWHNKDIVTRKGGPDDDGVDDDVIITRDITLPDQPLDDPTSTTTSTTSTTTSTTSTTSTTTTATTSTSSTSTDSSTTTTRTMPPQQNTFDQLTALVQNAAFNIDPKIVEAEAREFRKLYTVGNYMLAGVSHAVENLQEQLSTDERSFLINKPGLIDAFGTDITNILKNLPKRDDFDGEDALMRAVRQQFDLGTSAASTVNTEFKSLFREFVTLGADNLLGIDPGEQAPANGNGQAALGPGGFFLEAKSRQEALNLLKDLKRALIRVVTNMSEAGTMGTAQYITIWSDILHDSLQLLNAVGENHVDTANRDDQHVWNVVAQLNGVSKANLEGYIANAREGGQLLDLAIAVYLKMEGGELLENDEDATLRRIFHDPAFLDDNIEKSVAQRLRPLAIILDEHWIPNWT